MLQTENPDIVQEDLYLPPSESRVRLHLRRKYNAAQISRDSGRIIVFVHGATFSGVPAFDAPLPGGSWLDFAAAQGHDVYALDVRGYGLSEPPDSDWAGWRSGKPYARTLDAESDLSAAIDFILDRTGADRVDLVGWSWGTTICGGYSARNSHKVRRLVMYAPLWIMTNLAGADMPLGLPPLTWFPWAGPIFLKNLEAFRSVTLAEAHNNWCRGLNKVTADELISRDLLEPWWGSAVSSDPIGAMQSPPVVRAPNGVVADLVEYWASGVPTYDPSLISVPVLTVLGEWDFDTPPYMARELFRRLTAAPYKRLEILGRGTHSMLLETTRLDLYRRVQSFLTEDVVTALCVLVPFILFSARNPYFWDLRWIPANSFEAALRLFS